MRFFFCWFLLAPQILLAAYSEEYTAYLLTAVTHGNYEKVVEALDKNADPNAGTEKIWEGGPVAVRAYEKNDMEIMKALLKKGAEKRPVLEAAVKKSDIGTVEFLYNEGAKLEDDLLFDAGNKGFEYTTNKPNLDMLEWLLQKGLNVNATQYYTGLLFWALFKTWPGNSREQPVVNTFSPSYPMLDLLLKFKVDTSLPVDYGKTIFELIDAAKDITPQEKESLKQRLTKGPPSMHKSRAKL